MLQVSNFDELSPMMGWVFVNMAVWVISVSVSNPSKTDWFIKLDFGSICTLVCHQFPLDIYSHLPGIVSHTRCHLHSSFLDFYTCLHTPSCRLHFMPYSFHVLFTHQTLLWTHSTRFLLPVKPSTITADPSFLTFWLFLMCPIIGTYKNAVILAILFYSW